MGYYDRGNQRNSGGQGQRSEWEKLYIGDGVIDQYGRVKTRLELDKLERLIAEQRQQGKKSLTIYVAPRREQGKYGQTHAVYKNQAVGSSLAPQPNPNLMKNLPQVNPNFRPAPNQYPPQANPQWGGSPQGQGWNNAPMGNAPLNQNDLEGTPIPNFPEDDVPF